MHPENTIRFAVVTGGSPSAATLEVVRDYLPKNYSASEHRGRIIIEGEDYAGWTLEKYVLPRLGSGLIAAREMTPAEVREMTREREEGSY